MIERKIELTIKKSGAQYIKKGFMVNKNAIEQPAPCKKKPNPWVAICSAETLASHKKYPTAKADSRASAIAKPYNLSPCISGEGDKIKDNANGVAIIE